MTRTLLLALLVIAGCGGDLLGPDFGRTFTRFGGCGDVIFFAVDADDETMVTFSSAGLVAAALESGTESTTVLAFPSDDGMLEVEQGSRISDATCDDVIEGPGPRVQRSWIAVSGTATVRIRPDVETGAVRGDLLLREVELVSGGDRVTLDLLEWLDASVGWYPG